jgi:hypothetical protein
MHAEAPPDTSIARGTAQVERYTSADRIQVVDSTSTSIASHSSSEIWRIIMLHTSSVPWEGDLDRALEHAKRENKFVLLDIFNPE